MTKLVAIVFSLFGFLFKQIDVLVEKIYDSKPVLKLRLRRIIKTYSNYNFPKKYGIYRHNRFIDEVELSNKKFYTRLKKNEDPLSKENWFTVFLGVAYSEEEAKFRIKHNVFR